MAFTVNKKAFCVLEFAKTESVVTVQREISDHVPHRTTYRQNNSWMVHEFQHSGCLCAAKRTGRPGLWASVAVINKVIQHKNKLVTFVYSWRGVKRQMAKNAGISLYSRCIKVMDLDIQETKIIVMSIYIDWLLIKMQHIPATPLTNVYILTICLFCTTTAVYKSG